MKFLINSFSSKCSKAQDFNYLIMLTKQIVNKKLYLYSRTVSKFVVMLPSSLLLPKAYPEKEFSVPYFSMFGMITKFFRQ